MYCFELRFWKNLSYKLFWVDAKLDNAITELEPYLRKDLFELLLLTLLDVLLYDDDCKLFVMDFLFCSWFCCSLEKLVFCAVETPLASFDLFEDEDSEDVVEEQEDDGDTETRLLLVVLLAIWLVA